MRQAAGAAAEAQHRIESLEADIARAAAAAPVDSSGSSDLVQQLQVECEQLRATLTDTQAGEAIARKRTSLSWFRRLLLPPFDSVSIL